jgi:hypothetical protein
MPSSQSRRGGAYCCADVLRRSHRLRSYLAAFFLREAMLKGCASR